MVVCVCVRERVVNGHRDFKYTFLSATGRRLSAGLLINSPDVINEISIGTFCFRQISDTCYLAESV